MTPRSLSCVGALIAGVTVLTISDISGAVSSHATVPNEPSLVSVQGRQLVVQKAQPDGSLAAPAPYLIKGVDWIPAAGAPATGPAVPPASGTVPYGFFFNEADVMNYWLQQEVFNRYQTDIPLIAQMNANTVRVYADFGTNITAVQQVLDTFYNNGIMVIMTVASGGTDISSGRYLQTVQQWKNHPAILMWALGNEWNFNNFYGAYGDVYQTAAAVEAAAIQIKNADPNHPVTSSLGDKFVLTPNICGPDTPGTDIPTILPECPHVDVWSLNSYPGQSFGTRFDQMQSLTTKPFYFSEFGIDSYNTTSYTLPFTACTSQGNEAKVTGGSDDEVTQSSWDQGLWNEIAAHLSSMDPAQPCLGGTIFIFSDQIWKVGNYNVNLGGLVDYDGPDNIPNTPDDDTSYASYNADGFYEPGSFQDAISNEEYYGLVKADRTPKLAYTTLQNYYAGLGVALTLYLPSSLPVGGQLTVTYPATVTIAKFNWTLTPSGGSASTFSTTSGVLNLAPLDLAPGNYTVSVQAQNAQGQMLAQVQGTVTLVSADLTGMRCYPSPWRSDRNTGKPVTFDRLTSGCSIKIFTLSGEWVATLPTADNSTTWDLKNNSGDAVSSGIYFYLVTDDQNRQTRGKFTIIR